MNLKKIERFFIPLLVASYVLLVVPFLGSVHLFDWDEINFAEAAREMLVTGDWLNVQIDFEPFWEKPPLFIWLQAISMSIFGIGEFGARFPNAVVGLVTLLFLRKVVKERFGFQAAMLATMLFFGSLTPRFYFNSGIIDPLFNLFIFYSVFQLVLASETKLTKKFLLAGVSLGAAVLTKGPAALLIVGLSGLAYQLFYRHRFYSVKNLVVLVVGIVLIPGIWFGVQTYANGFWFIQQFVVYQIELFSQPVASHGQPVYYHVLVLLIGCFPLVILALPALFKRKHANMLITWSRILFWVVLILFSLVTTKIIHYSSMCYIPAAIVGGVYLADKLNIYSWQKFMLGFFGLLWGVALVAIAAIGNNGALREDLLSLIKDDFTVAQFRTNVEWNGWEYAIGIVFLVLLIFTFRKTETKYFFQNLVIGLFGFVTVFTFIMAVVIPRVEGYTQNDWVKHLESYQGKEMLHMTQGFKSYAHIFYTHQQASQKFNDAKTQVLKSLNRESFYDLPQSERQEYDSRIRKYIINETTIPFTISTKLNKCSELAENPKLNKVFEGNGYCVWERK